jgi:hypothetical protein
VAMGRSRSRLSSLSHGQAPRTTSSQHLTHNAVSNTPSQAPCCTDRSPKLLKPNSQLPGRDQVLL